MPTWITMTKLFFISDFKYFFNQCLLISQQGTIFNYIPVDNLISQLNNSILSSPRYLASDISYTFNLC